MKSPRLLALLGCLAATAASGADKLPTSLFIGMVKGQMEQQCEQSRAQSLTATTDRERGAARAGVLLQCECMPAELKSLEERKDLPGEVTEQEALGLMKPHLGRCASKALRQMLSHDCLLPENQEPGIKDQKAYCGCLSAKVDKLSDEEIANEAMGAHDDHEERVEARRDGEPAPPKRQSFMDTINNDCRAEQGAPPNP